MASIFENTDSKVKIHVLHDDTLTDDNRQKFIRTAEKYSQIIEFYDVTDYMNKFSQEIPNIKVIAGIFSLGALYRLFIPDVITETDKVIYLDSDIIADMDIKDLWNIDIQGNILAGVVIGRHNLQDIVRKTLCDIDHWSYVNSGVLVMDLAQIRQHGNLFVQSVQWFSRHSHLASLPDQDALNSIYRGRIKLIDQKYNNWLLDGDTSHSIIHTWKHKSWLGLAGFKSDALYWKYYTRSAWGENVNLDDMIDILNEAAYRPAAVIKKRSFIRRVCGILKRKFLRRPSVIIAGFLYKEAVYHIKKFLPR